MSQISPRLRGSGMLAATAITWGGMFPIMKPLLGKIDPFTLTLVRFGFAALVFLVILLAVEGREAFATQGKAFRLWWLGTLGFAGFGLLLVLGLNNARPEHASVVPALMPLISIGIATVRSRTWPRPKAATAVALGILGVVLVVTRGNPAALLAGQAGHGEALVFIGATCWVFYTLGAAEFPGWSGLRYTTLTISLGVLSVLAAEIVALSVGAAKAPTATLLLEATPQFAYLVFAASVMGFQFWNAGMRTLGPARGILFINLVPVTAFTIALLGGHIPTGREVLGVGLVISALVLNSWMPKPKRALALQRPGAGAAWVVSPDA